MDTIIFFYKKNGLDEPSIKIKRLTGYRLIKVGINAEGDRWFGQDMGQDIPQEWQESAETQAPDNEKRGLMALFQRIGRVASERKHRREAQRRFEEMLAKRESEIRAAEERMKVTAAYLTAKAGGDGTWSYVCEECLEKCAVWSAWLTFFKGEKFDGWQQRFWLERLMPCARHSQLVILGSCEDIFGLIESLARNLKSLRWFLEEEDCDSDVHDFVEDFYIEYGLAITLQTVCGKNAFRKLRLVCREPVDILDFTQEPYMALTGIARGSVWLDMRSLEEKRRRITARDAGIEYFSLKERWERE